MQRACVTDGGVLFHSPAKAVKLTPEAGCISRRSRGRRRELCKRRPANFRSAEDLIESPPLSLTAGAILHAGTSIDDLEPCCSEGFIELGDSLEVVDEPREIVLPAAGDNVALVGARELLVRPGQEDATSVNDREKHPIDERAAVEDVAY